jgi:glycosyltransferase involved in cell wall biosynthesis
VLSKVNHSADLSIYGPDEDRLYWTFCMDLIKNLPVYITVRYHGEVKYENVANVFAEHDLFVFPTRGENFGHVIYEALSVGTSVIVSDQTPWLSDSHGALQVLSLDQPDSWIAAIDLWASCDQDFYDNHRRAAIKYSIDYIEKNKSVKQNLDLFRTALEN